MQKSERHRAIFEIISGDKFSRQDLLAEALRRKGFKVTQASVSRDLDELGIVKSNGVYARPVHKPDASPFGNISITSAGESMLVAKCASGLASAAAVRIDAARLASIAGTIAGDDTIFIALKNGTNKGTLIDSLRRLFDLEMEGN